MFLLALGFILVFKCDSLNFERFSKEIRLGCENSLKNNNLQRIVALTITPMLLCGFEPVYAENLPSIEKCFNAVRKEIEGSESIARLSRDIDEENWTDLITFSREYEAGFRGGVLKSAWKQLSGDTRNRGIEISNSFTFDLIGLNKAGRKKDSTDARAKIELIKQDLKDFSTLENSAGSQ